MTFYKLLDLPSTATINEIKKRYKQLALIVIHPLFKRKNIIE